MAFDDRRTPATYLVTRLKEALAADDRLSQLDIEVRITGPEVVLFGVVQTHERRDIAEQIARAVLPHHRIGNELAVIGIDGAEARGATKPVRIAAVGDVHYGMDSAGALRDAVARLDDDADMLLLAGDLTRHGTLEEARVLAADLIDAPVPTVAVLGNHDHHSDLQAGIAEILQRAGVRVLEGSSTRIAVDGTTVGIAGTKGFGGGFMGACGSEFGERILKDFIGHTRALAEQLEAQLRSLDTDLRIALLHFSPVEDTLHGERLEIYPWLGSYLLAEAIDGAGCDLALHGHAHGGCEIGLTAGGVPVRNVAQPVLGAPYKVYCLAPRPTAVVGA